MREQVDDEEGDDDDDDIPDEYECEMMCSLMQDPVRLPGGVVVDRSSIERHLLDSDMNPYTREPLTIQDVEPLPELKAEIEAYRKERRRARKAAREAAALAPPKEEVKEGGNK